MVSVYKNCKTCYVALVKLIEHKLSERNFVRSPPHIFKRNHYLHQKSQEIIKQIFQRGIYTQRGIKRKDTK